MAVITRVEPAVGGEPASHGTVARLSRPAARPSRRIDASGYDDQGALTTRGSSTKEARPGSW